VLVEEGAGCSADVGGACDDPVGDEDEEVKKGTLETRQLF